ncbi:hypothetical protein Peetri_00098 [Pseudomonas phage vB_PpuM-Peetri]
MTDKKDYPSMGAQLTEDQIKQLNTTGVAYAKVEELTPDQHAAVKTAIDSAAQAAEHPGYAGLDGLVRLQQELAGDTAHFVATGQTIFSKNYQPHPDQALFNSELVQMAILDFLGYLTSRDEVTTLSSHHEASPAITAFETWLERKGLLDVIKSEADKPATFTMDNWTKQLVRASKVDTDVQS